MPDEEEDTSRLTGANVINMRDLIEARRRRIGVDTRKPQPEPGVVQKPKTLSADEEKPKE